MSVFSKPGLYLRQPSGSDEQVTRMVAAGFGAIAVNVGDHELADFQLVLERAERAGVPAVAWGRIENIVARTGNDYPGALGYLAERGRRVGGRAIFNAEKELLDGRLTPKQVATAAIGLDACVSMEPWAGDLDLSPLAGCEIHLQLFPQENDTSTRPRDCRMKAFAQGAERVSFMVGMHDVGPELFPPLQAPYWIYTGDDMGNDYAAWSPLEIPPLTLPYTGPLYGPGHPKWGTRPRKSGTAKALKIACHRAGFGHFSNPDRFFNAPLEQALRHLQRWAGIEPVSGAYGRGTYEVLRTLAAAIPEETYALPIAGEQLIREDAKAAA